MVLCYSKRPLLNPQYCLKYHRKRICLSDNLNQSKLHTYRVRIRITNLNIRKGPGTNYGKTGQFTGAGVFTIIAESTGIGASKWGKLKSGAGWISLDYATKL